MPRQNLTQDVVPPRLSEIASQLGINIARARKRRRMRQVDLAERAGLSRETLRRVESGELGTSIVAYLGALWALELHEDLRAILRAGHDRDGRALMDQRLPARVRPPRP